jgi:hypothetical protein
VCRVVGLDKLPDWVSWGDRLTSVSAAERSSSWSSVRHRYAHAYIHGIGRKWCGTQSSGFVVCILLCGRGVVYNGVVCMACCAILVLSRRFQISVWHEERDRGALENDRCMNGTRVGMGCHQNRMGMH